MSIEHIVVVVGSPNFTASEKAVLIALAFHADVNNQAWPSVPRIRRESGLAESTIWRSLKALIKCECLMRETRRGRSAIWTLDMEAIATHPQTLVGTHSQLHAPSIDTHTQSLVPAHTQLLVPPTLNCAERNVKETTVETSVTVLAPEWHSVFHSIEANPHDTQKADRCVSLQKWIHGELTDRLALETAKDMRDVLEWDATKKRPWGCERAGGGEFRYTNLYLVFRRWAKRRRDHPQQPSWNGARASPSGGHEARDYAAAEAADKAATRRAQEAGA